MSAGKERKKLVKKELLRQRDALKLAAEALFNDRKEALERIAAKDKIIEEYVESVREMRVDYSRMIEEAVGFRRTIVELVKERDELKGVIAASGLFPPLPPPDPDEVAAGYENGAPAHDRPQTA